MGGGPFHQEQMGQETPTRQEKQTRPAAGFCAGEGRGQVHEHTVSSQGSAGQCHSPPRKEGEVQILGRECLAHPAMGGQGHLHNLLSRQKLESS